MERPESALRWLAMFLPPAMSASENKISSSLASNQHFQDGGSAYANFRPTYPPELAAHLSGLCAHRNRALDVGCGNGQLSAQLADHFEHADASDVSADQLKNAAQRDNLHYQLGSAEHLAFEASSIDLITVAQAAHWFDLPRFYAEVERIAAPGAVLALISYSVLSIEPPLAERFDRFYVDDLASFWPPERRHVERGYRDLPFPFEELDPPSLDIVRQWDCAHFLGYVETWSAVKAARRQGQGDLIDAFCQDARRLWPGSGQQALKIVWPIRMRLARL